MLRHDQLLLLAAHRYHRLPDHHVLRLEAGTGNCERGEERGGGRWRTRSWRQQLGGRGGGGVGGGSSCAENGDGPQGGDGKPQLKSTPCRTAINLSTMRRHKIFDLTFDT